MDPKTQGPRDRMGMVPERRGQSFDRLVHQQTPETGDDLRALAISRMGAQYLVDYRNQLVENYQQWKSRIKHFRKMYAGEWETIWPDEFKIRSRPKVMNLTQVAADDIARLVAETQPLVKVKPRSTDDTDIENAYLRQKVYESYWKSNSGRMQIPTLAHDLAGTGFCAMAVGLDKKSDYPKFTRLDPVACYPTVLNDELLDLIVISRFTPKQAERILGIKLQPPRGPSDSVEIIDYYDDIQQLRIWTWARAAEQQVASFEGAEVFRWIHGLSRVPVGWANLRTADGAYRGMFDQNEGILQAMNRILHLELDYASQQVYAPFLSYQIENDRDPPGPHTIYRKLTPDGTLVRVEPARNSPDLLRLMEFLMEQARQGAGYPGQRQGNVPNSIASAAFVNSVLGQLTTQVKHIQDLVGHMRQDLNSVAAEVEVEYLDYDKQLLLSSDEHSSYRPSDVFSAGDYVNTVVYGAGAGLDRLNAKVALLQDLGAKVASHKDAREQTDYVTDERQTRKEIDIEDVEDALKQQLLQGGDLVILSRVYVEMKKGKSLEEAADVALDLAQEREQLQHQMEMQLKAAAAGGTQGAGAPGGQAAAPGEAPGLPAGGQAPSAPTEMVPGIEQPTQPTIQPAELPIQQRQLLRFAPASAAGGQ